MIDLTKTYKTQDGYKARFLGEIKNSDYPLIFAVTGPDNEEHTQTYNKNGMFYSNNEPSSDDLVEYNPWKELPIDTPIYVRMTANSEWCPRYFAGMSSDGKVQAFDNGTTSFTNKGGEFGRISEWAFAKLKDEA